jgi:pSer/pThr/pTyr-binding forkhead associated (FHA) protein
VTGALAVAGGPAAGLRVQVDRRLVVGRRDADVNVNDPEISRRHATVEPGPGDALVVCDLGSTNGTWVNGTRIAGPTELRAGDELVLGNSLLRLEAGPARSVPAPVAPAPAGPAPSAPAPDRPFGAFAPAPMPAPGRRRRSAATRLQTGLLVTWIVIVLDAAALVVYFAAR